MNVQFGTGVLILDPNAGDTATDPTPQQMIAIQSANVDFKSTLQKMFGQNQLPIAKARGQIEVTGKAKLMALSPQALNQVYFGQAAAVGMDISVIDEAGTIPSDTTYTVTVTNAANFSKDGGVRDSAGAQMVKVDASPATGQYTVADGVYTFSADDAGKAVRISYTYSSTTAGTTVTLANKLQGYAPEFRAILSNIFRGKRLAIELYNCTAGGLSIATKGNGWWEADLDFEACCDDTDTLGRIMGDIN